MNGAKLLAGIAGETWVITEAKLGAMIEVIERHADGIRLDEAGIRAAVGVDDFTRQQIRQDHGPVAVLNLTGILSQKANLVTRFSGGTSTQQFGTVFREALDDRQVRTILINIDSPGGSVYGVSELSTMIHAARGAKRIVAVADPMAASGAYWVGSAAGELYVTPSGEVGSIGAFAIHGEESARLDRMGIKYTIVRAGEHKARMSSVEPLSDDGRSQIQRGVDAFRDMFVADVARNRAGAGTRPPADFGGGRMFVAEQAVKLGMADAVASFEDVLNREIERARSRSGLAAARGSLALAGLDG